MKCVARRVVDRHILRLIKAWLVAPVEDDDGKGGKTRVEPTGTTSAAHPRAHRSHPCVEPVHATVHRGVEDDWGSNDGGRPHIVNYADDFVICCKRGADDAMAAMRADHGAAEADGERGQDPSVPDTAGAVRLPGLHLRTMLLTQGRARLHRHPAFEEEHQADGGQHQRSHGSPHWGCWMPRRSWVS